MTTTAPAELAMCKISTNSGDTLVPCEPINEWLAITPDFGMDKDGKTSLSGAFAVTFRPSGTRLSEGAGCIECCRSAGKALAALDVNWSTLTADTGAEWLAALPAETQHALAEARTVEWLCDAELCETESAAPSAATPEGN